MTVLAPLSAISIRRVDVAVAGSGRHDADTWNRAHLAHAPEWADVIARAYGHAPLYLEARNGTARVGALPAFIVRRPFMGTMVTSMPFLDGGGPTSMSSDVSRLLAEHLLREARSAGASVVELRCAQRLDVPWNPREHKVNMVLPLGGNPDRIWTGLPRTVRNQVRKAERSGLSIHYGDASALDAFYGIFSARMRDLGSPVHGRQFFRAVLDGFGDRARVVLVRKGDTPIGGLIAVACNDTLTTPWAACATEYLTLCPNMLLYWEAIRTACTDGFRSFDFGRSTRGSGTHRFKLQWGAEEHPLFWYTIPTRLAAVIRPRGRHPAPRLAAAGAAALTGLWRHLPLTFTQRVGPHVRRYLVQ